MISDKKLKVSCGIDTLYYYCDIDLNNYTVIYDEIQEHIKNDNFKYLNLNYLGTAQGYSWYMYSKDEIKICKIGFKSYSKQRHIKDVFIQLVGSGIYYHGIKEVINLVDKELQYIGIESKEKFVSRIDLNIFTNISFEHLDTSWISTRSKSESQIFTIMSGKKIETVYFGKRANGKVLRIYNKIKELKQDLLNEKNVILINKLKQDDLIKNIDEDTLWNIELELHRKFLKKNYGINTLDDMFNKLDSVWFDEMSRFKILEKNDKYLKHIINDKQRIPELKIWTKIKESYTKDKTFQKGIKLKTMPYKLTKDNLFKQVLQNLNKYNSYQDKQKDKLDMQTFTEELIDYIADINYDNKEVYDDDSFKYIPVKEFDKRGLWIKSHNAFKAFYDKKENE